MRPLQELRPWDITFSCHNIVTCLQKQLLPWQGTSRNILSPGIAAPPPKKKSPSYHYSLAHKAPKIPKPQTLQYPVQLKSLSHSWGQSSLHPHQQRSLLMFLLQREGGLVLHSLICFCCSHHLPNPFTPADISKRDLGFFFTQMTKSFSPIMLWTQLHVSHCSSATHRTQAGWMP